jgi:hypothetical protein
LVRVGIPGLWLRLRSRREVSCGRNAKQEVSVSQKQAMEDESRT